MNNYSILEKGMVFSNYKELCEALNWKVTRGNSKAAQIKELERHCTYTKEGHKIIILDVFSKTKPKKDNRIGRANGDIYGSMVQLLILNYLNEQETKSVTISKTNILQHIGLANRNYVALKNYPQKLANYISYNVIYVYDFYNVNDTKLKNITERALNSLENKRLILCETVIKVKREGQGNQCIATSYEKACIIETEKKFLNIYGYDDMRSIRMSSNWRKFKKDVENELKEELGIEYYYFAYDITINHKYITEEKENLESEVIDILINNKFDKDENIRKVNDLIIENINADTLKRSMDIIKNYEKKKYRLTDEYTDATKLLTSILIDTKAKMLINDVMNFNGKKVDICDSLPF